MRVKEYDRPGRPTKFGATEKLSLRLTPEQKQFVLESGGGDFLRSLIDIYIQKEKAKK